MKNNVSLAEDRQSTAQLAQLPPRLRKAVEQMLWRAKGCVESRKWTPRLMSLTEPDEMIIGRDPGHPFLFLLPLATVADKDEIQKRKGSFARLWDVSRNYLHAMLR
jgi:hypothetical protein